MVPLRDHDVLEALPEEGRDQRDSLGFIPGARSRPALPLEERHDGQSRGQNVPVSPTAFTRLVNGQTSAS